MFEGIPTHEHGKSHNTCWSSARALRGGRGERKLRIYSKRERRQLKKCECSKICCFSFWVWICKRRKKIRDWVLSFFSYINGL
jgi:hypothetical protein